MNVLLFGATGMVGDGVLHECLANERVTAVTAVVRSPLGITHPKLQERRRTDFFDYSDFGSDLATIDACFFCLGVSAVGMDEAKYTRLTFDITLAAARALAAARPGAAFCYISGEGADSSEKGRTMWARVKGRTENGLFQLPLKAYMFRPGFIRPRPGKRSKTFVYRATYAVFAPMYPLLRRIAPKHVTTVENVGRSMIIVAAKGHTKRVLGNADINLVAAGG